MDGKSMDHEIERVAPAEGKLGVLLPGLGAVATTFVAGVELCKKGMGRPFGSVTQLQRLKPGEPADAPGPLVREAVPLAGLDDLVFGGWDVSGRSAWETARDAGVLPPETLEPVRDRLEAIRPWPAVFEPEYVPNLSGEHVKSGSSKMELAEALRADIDRFRRERDLARAVVVWCASTEVHLEPTPVHETLEAFEEGLRSSSAAIPPSMIYAYAAIREGVPFVNGAPNLAADVPALRELAEREGVCVAGRDFKTGQTLLKTVLAPGLKARMLGLAGWYSTNILGNLDGQVLDDPGAFEAKEKTKTSVLDTILEAESFPELYGDVHHRVRIDYYPPRGDAKEGWDNLDIFGWLGLPMQVKVNFLCRDSILAAPLVLDLALLADLASRAGQAGVQEWLSFYFKSPMTRVATNLPAHDLFAQERRLHARLRRLAAAPVEESPSPDGLLSTPEAPETERSPA